MSIWQDCLDADLGLEIAEHSAAMQLIAKSTLADMEAARSAEGCCAWCGDAFKASGIASGYGIRPRGEKICYACCAVCDKADMRRNGAADLYLVKKGGVWVVTNWPNSFHLRAWGVRKVSNGYTAYFTFDGADWIVRNQGDIDLARCRRLKHRVR